MEDRLEYDITTKDDITEPSNPLVDTTTKVLSTMEYNAATSESFQGPSTWSSNQLPSETTSQAWLAEHINRTHRSPITNESGLSTHNYKAYTLSTTNNTPNITWHNFMTNKSSYNFTAISSTTPPAIMMHDLMAFTGRITGLMVLDRALEGAELHRFPQHVEEDLIKESGGAYRDTRSVDNQIISMDNEPGRRLVSVLAFLAISLNFHGDIPWLALH